MDKAVIPKICHFIWTKGVPMSWLQTLSVKSFRKYNPDWKIILHLISQSRGKNVYNAEYSGPDNYTQMLIFIDEVRIARATNLHGIQESDKLRTRILYQEGGVYSDFDMLWLRAMSGFPGDFETTVCWHLDHYNMSNIVSEPGGKFLEEIIEKQERVTSRDYQAYLTQLFNTSYPDVTELIERFPRIRLIPYKWFYPYSIYHLEQLYNDDIDLTAGAFGVHWFNGHRLSQNYIIIRGDCSMTTILKNEGWL